MMSALPSPVPLPSEHHSARGVCSCLFSWQHNNLQHGQGCENVYHASARFRNWPSGFLSASAMHRLSACTSLCKHALTYHSSPCISSQGSIAQISTSFR